MSRQNTSLNKDVTFYIPPSSAGIVEVSPEYFTLIIPEFLPEFDLKLSLNNYINFLVVPQEEMDSDTPTLEPTNVITSHMISYEYTYADQLFTQDWKYCVNGYKSIFNVQNNGETVQVLVIRMRRNDHSLTEFNNLFNE